MVEHVDVEGLPGLGGDAPGLLADAAAVGAVDGVAILLQPFADRQEAGNGLLREGAVRAGTDVEEEVGALSGGLDEELDQLLGALVVVVVDVIAPAVVDGLAERGRACCSSLPAQASTAISAR